MKTITILSALLIGAGLSLAGPDGKCKKGDCKKGEGAAAAVAGAPAVLPVVLNEDEAKPERRAKPGAREGKPGAGKPEGRRGRGGPGGMLERIKAKDANEDGAISLAEFKEGIPEDRLERATKFFGMLDKDSDGSISADELKAPPGRGGPPGAQRGEGDRRGPPGAQRGGKPGGERGARGGKPGAGGDAPARPQRPPLGD